MPFLSPNQHYSVKALKGKISHSMDLLIPSSPGVFQLCLWPLIAPGYLGESCHASHQPSDASTPVPASIYTDAYITLQYFPSVVDTVGWREKQHPAYRTLVYWWWQFDVHFVHLTAPVVTTFSIILSSNKIQNADTLVLASPGPPGKWLLNGKI